MYTYSYARTATRRVAGLALLRYDVTLFGRSSPRSATVFVTQEVASTPQHNLSQILKYDLPSVGKAQAERLARIRTKVYGCTVSIPQMVRSTVDVGDYHLRSALVEVPQHMRPRGLPDGRPLCPRCRHQYI